MPVAALLLAPAISPGALAASATFAAGVALKIAADPLALRRLGQEARQRIGSAGGVSGPGGSLSFRPPPLGGRLPPRGPQGPGPDFGWMLPVGAALLGTFPTVQRGLAQLWALLNSRPEGFTTTAQDDTIQRFESLSGLDLPLFANRYLKVEGGTDYGSSGTSGGFENTGEIDLGYGVSVTFTGGGSVSLEVTPADPGPKYAPAVVATVYKADGSSFSLNIFQPVTLVHDAGLKQIHKRTFRALGVTHGGVPALEVSGRPSGFVPPTVEPEAEPNRPARPPLAPPAPPAAPPAPPATDPPLFPGQPAPGPPAPQPPGTPAPAPAIPRPVRPGEWQPGGPGTPSQPVPPGFPAPTIAPSRAPARVPVRPVAVPGAQPTTPGGQVIPRPQPRPPVTRPGSEVINGITIPNRPPAPTLQGIAAEVGRIEQKLAYQLRNPEDGNQDLDAKLQELLDALENQQDAGVYELGGPCERDPEGQPIPFDDTKAQFDWGGNTSALANIASRIDALAELMQYHKLLRQPSCKNPQPTGEWVTVNFRQIDFEAP